MVERFWNKHWKGESYPALRFLTEQTNLPCGIQLSVFSSPVSKSNKVARGLYWICSKIRKNMDCSVNICRILFTRKPWSAHPPPTTVCLAPGELRPTDPPALGEKNYFPLFRNTLMIMQNKIVIDSYKLCLNSFERENLVQNLNRLQNEWCHSKHRRRYSLWTLNWIERSDLHDFQQTTKFIQHRNVLRVMTVYAKWVAASGFIIYSNSTYRPKAFGLILNSPVTVISPTKC